MFPKAVEVVNEPKNTTVSIQQDEARKRNAVLRGDLRRRKETAKGSMSVLAGYNGGMAGGGSASGSSSAKVEVFRKVHDFSTHGCSNADDPLITLALEKGR
jgi:hypothetical protein